jgi:signal transduction histidine kinase/DNA-binding response OmpR family regulator
MTVALVAVTMLLVLGADIYFVARQNAENENRHVEILTSETQEAANALAQFITERQRMIETFAIDNEDLLAEYAQAVDDERLRSRIDGRLERWFPGYFTFTLANTEGVDIVDDLEGFVGAACQQNIKTYLSRLFGTGLDASYETVIHPQAHNYHFDVMAPWRSSEELNGVFFVSFYPDILQSLIKSYQSPGHRLVLIHRDRDHLIEVGAEGTRDVFGAHRDITMSAEEISEIRAIRDIPGSLWRLVGYVEPGLVARENAENWRIAALFALFVLAAGGLSLAKILSLDRAQARAWSDLNISNKHLAEMAKAQTALREAAESGEKAKAQFLASMSHEIRTPLNAIIGLTDLTLKTDLSEHQRDHLTRVARAGRSLLGLINDILDFSKIEAGKLQIESVEFDLDEVLENLATVVSTKIEENANELVIAVDRNIPSALCGDPLRLGQVLINLVGNAAKFTQRGEIVVDVARAVEDEREWLKFSVRDSGIGMTEAQVERLFRPFTQADQSVTRTHGGTGLGLSISRELVEAMGGTIGVESVPGEGSHFFFRVPYEPVEGTVPRRGFEGIDPRATRVLVVDDNRVVRETLREALSSLRFKVDVAESGAEALDMYRKAQTLAPYSVVLMDWRMPEIDGIETIRRIQSENAERQMPAIIMVSAEDMQAIAGELKVLGVAHFVQKPINTSFLIDTMMAFFETGSDRRPVHARLRAESSDPRAASAGIHLLLAEDVELNRMVALGVLQNAGMTADVAENGKQVLEILEREGPDRYAAVLMDIEMPEMDGLTATRKIRSELGFTDLPVIAMTAHALAEERERCREAGMDAHISKPFEAAELISTINRFAAKSRAGGMEPGEGAVDLDLEEVTARLMLPRETIVRLLAKFRTDYDGCPADLKRLLDRGEVEEARRLMHSVKGVASSLGLGAVSRVAEEIEQGLEGGAGRPNPADLERFEDAHAQTMRAISRELQLREPEPDRA